jgi:hypothetical protein
MGNSDSGPYRDGSGVGSHTRASEAQASYCPLAERTGSSRGLASGLASLQPRIATQSSVRCIRMTEENHESLFWVGLRRQGALLKKSIHKANTFKKFLK